MSASSPATSAIKNRIGRSGVSLVNAPANIRSPQRKSSVKAPNAGTNRHANQIEKPANTIDCKSTMSTPVPVLYSEKAVAMK